MFTETTSLVLANEIMCKSPRERDPRYFRTWQRVSLALQRALRAWISERCLQDVVRFQDRDAAYPILVYAACRLSYGRPKTEFTFDVADPGVLASALHNIGMSLKLVLEPVEKRLHAAGMSELARRYTAVWRQDILRTVKNKSKPLIALLAAEAKLVDGVIDLGTSGDIRRFNRTANAALRNVAGEDMRDLIDLVLKEAIRVLTEEQPCGVDNLVDVGVAQHDHAPAAGSPHRGVGGKENSDHRDSHRGSQMTDPRIVSDVQPAAGEPSGQIIEVVVSDRAIEVVFGARDPFDGASQLAGDCAEI